MNILEEVYQIMKKKKEEEKYGLIGEMISKLKMPFIINGNHI
jgi:hypothetical protein